VHFDFAFFSKLTYLMTSFKNHNVVSN